MARDSFGAAIHHLRLVGSLGRHVPIAFSGTMIARRWTSRKTFMSEFSVGDRVKAVTGEKGQIIALNADGKSAYVQMERGTKGTIRRLPLESLTRIDREQAEPKSSGDRHT
jgi:dsDNA-specific endonuclease/ATPase MutS2